MIFLERELESAKIELTLKNDFNLLDAFKMFDTRSVANISVQDVTLSLRDILGLTNFNNDDLYLIFRRFDLNEDGKLNLKEFSSIMMPTSREYAALLSDRPEIYMSK